MRGGGQQKEVYGHNHCRYVTGTDIFLKKLPFNSPKELSSKKTKGD